MFSLTVFFCLLAGAMAHTVNINDAMKNSKFFEVNTCDDSTLDGRFITSMNSALTQWKVELKQEFCSMQCKADTCGCISPLQGSFSQPKSQYKRQLVNIDNSFETDSTFIEVNICRMKKFADLLQPLNSYIFDMKKRDWKDMCVMQCDFDMCGCFKTTTMKMTTTTTFAPPPLRQTTPQASYGYMYKAVETTTPFIPEPVKFVQTTAAYKAYKAPTTTSFVAPPVKMTTAQAYYSAPETTTVFVPEPVKFVPTTAAYKAPTTTMFIPEPVKFVPTTAAYKAYKAPTTTMFIPEPVKFVPTTAAYKAPTTTMFVPKPVKFVPTTQAYKAYKAPETTTPFVPEPVMMTQKSHYESSY